MDEQKDDNFTRLFGLKGLKMKILRSNSSSYISWGKKIPIYDFEWNLVGFEENNKVLIIWSECRWKSGFDVIEESIENKIKSYSFKSKEFAALGYNPIK